MSKRFPFYQQLDQMDCGPTCLRMVAQHYGKSYSLQSLREKCHIDREGVSLLGITEAAESIGMRTLVIKLPYDSDADDNPSLQNIPYPCIVHWEQRHFVVVYDANQKYVWVADPAKGKMKMPRKEFENGWISDGDKGIALLLETAPEFYEEEGEKIKKTGIGFLFKYFRPYKRLITQLVIGLLLGSLFQLIFPFLTQAIVDIGIENQDINFIYLILMAQLMLFLSQTAVNFIQSWILLHIGTRINISILSDFLIKLMKLPIAFFDSKMIGDLLQRVYDHERIKTFLTTSTLLTLFSFFNLIVFGVVLLIYNSYIFLIFFVASILYLGWISIFLKKRKVIDYQNFEQMSENRSALIELVQGMQEIKLQNSERRRRWQWMYIQARIFKVNIKALVISQYQDAGAGFITQLKDILISFVAAKAVIDGEMTLGMMLAVQYIIGQLNAPLQQMIAFVRNLQDAEISLERLGEIHDKDDEEDVNEPHLEVIPENADIKFENVSFQYNKLSDMVLEEVDLIIPKGKVTAIVGTSGSGKTTLVKLMLGFYAPTKGTIRVGSIGLENISKRLWRSKCGAVMQDGYIFSDTIANNVSESEGIVDRVKLLKAVKTANIQEFVETLPLHYNSMIGARGNGISQGQKQRLLIARAVYKNPEFLFFDEATNALDARNERVIMENMNEFFEGRTVVVVAHRLSTVKNADQIVVIERGKIVEQGTHEKLVALKGSYFYLVKDQLELGN
ncbi:MAG: ATP-binding cassette subfamily B protein [Saprospiraceae bacterium]|jgi:ATP-binding cassette subfamily B protein